MWSSTIPAHELFQRLRRTDLQKRLLSASQHTWSVWSMEHVELFMNWRCYMEASVDSSKKLQNFGISTGAVTTKSSRPLFNLSLRRLSLAAVVPTMQTAILLSCQKDRGAVKAMARTVLSSAYPTEPSVASPSIVVVKVSRLVSRYNFIARRDLVRQAELRV